MRVSEVWIVYLIPAGLPGVDEITPEPTDPICNDGIDNNCNGQVDECGPSVLPCGTPPSVMNAEYKEAADIGNVLFLLGLPMGAVLFLKRRRCRKSSDHLAEINTGATSIGCGPCSVSHQDFPSPRSWPGKIYPF